MKPFMLQLGQRFNALSARWRFALFLFATLVITVVLTVVSYSLYLVTVTAQLDLSRPGYKQALTEVSPTDPDASNFSATGPLDKKSLDDFKSKYDDLVNKAKSNTPFDPSA